jgi:hypothetical protein
VVLTFCHPQALDNYAASIFHLGTASTRPDDALFKRFVFGVQAEATALVETLDCSVVSSGFKHAFTLTASQLAAFTSRLSWNGLSYDVNEFTLTTDKAENDVNRVSLEAHDQAVALAEKEAGRKAIEDAQATALAKLRADEFEGRKHQENRNRFMNTSTVISKTSPIADTPINADDVLAEAEKAHADVMARLANAQKKLAEHKAAMTQSKVNALTTATALALAKIAQLEAELASNA